MNILSGWFDQPDISPISTVSEGMRGAYQRPKNLFDRRGCSWVAICARQQPNASISKRQNGQLGSWFNRLAHLGEAD
jgi:hypothetical protein